MNSKESSQVISIIGSIYTNYKPANYDIAIEAWRSIFHDVPYNVVVGALYSYAKSSNEFPPTPGQINEIIQQAVDKNFVPESEAWNMVILAIRNGAYGADEEYDKLPEDVQQAIGGSHYLHELALSEDVNWGVESSNFYRNLRSVRERQKNVENIPNSVKNLIEKMNEVKEAQLENRQETARLEQKEYYDTLSAQADRNYLEEKTELNDRQKGFADMLRERFGMPKKEELSEDEYSAEYYYDPSQDNKEDGWEGELFA